MSDGVDGLTGCRDLYLELLPVVDLDTIHVSRCRYVSIQYGNHDRRQSKTYIDPDGMLFSGFTDEVNVGRFRLIGANSS